MGSILPCGRSVYACVRANRQACSGSSPRELGKDGLDLGGFSNPMPDPLTDRADTDEITSAAADKLAM